jgi:hypothetical protein
MLAYVFWHQRQSKTSKEEYQRRLTAFHQALQQRQVQDFLFSFVLEIPYLPWMTKESEAYEDWYIVKNAAALDPLDEAAVTGICQEPHDQVAQLASNGTGGLYRLKGQQLDPLRLAELQTATWFNKPEGMSYSQLYTFLEQNHDAQADILWQRQMTMGPALEFCLHGKQRQPLPEKLQSIQVVAKPLFIGGQ